MEKTIRKGNNFLCYSVCHRAQMSKQQRHWLVFFFFFWIRLSALHPQFCFLSTHVFKPVFRCHAQKSSLLRCPLLLLWTQSLPLAGATQCTFVERNQNIFPAWIKTSLVSFILDIKVEQKQWFINHIEKFKNLFLNNDFKKLFNLWCCNSHI